jgi:hypothetical protein
MPLSLSRPSAKTASAVGNAREGHRGPKWWEGAVFDRIALRANEGVIIKSGR